MTLIAAVRGKKGPAIMGADSYLGDGGSTVHDLMAEPKIACVCLGSAWLGLAGDPAPFGDAIRALETLDLENDAFDLRLDLRDHMREKKVPTKNDDFFALLIHGRDIWAMDQSWAAYKLTRDFTAIGVGRDFAMGALAYASGTGALGKRPKRVIKRVMLATSLMVGGVRAPFDYSDVVIR